MVKLYKSTSKFVMTSRNNSSLFSVAMNPATSTTQMNLGCSTTVSQITLAFSGNLVLVERQVSNVLMEVIS